MITYICRLFLDLDFRFLKHFHFQIKLRKYKKSILKIFRVLFYELAVPPASTKGAKWCINELKHIISEIFNAWHFNCSRKLLA